MNIPLVNIKITTPLRASWSNIGTTGLPKRTFKISKTLGEKLFCSLIDGLNLNFAGWLMSVFQSDIGHGTSQKESLIIKAKFPIWRGGLIRLWSRAFLIWKTSAIQWARNVGLKVIIDLHGVPGSQVRRILSYSWNLLIYSGFRMVSTIAGSENRTRNGTLSNLMLNAQTWLLESWRVSIPSAVTLLPA